MNCFNFCCMFGYVLASLQLHTEYYFSIWLAVLFLCLCLCVLMFNDNATPNIKKNIQEYQLYCVVERETRKRKKSGPIKNRSLKCCELCFFFPLLNQHLNMGFYAEQTRPNTFFILFASFLSLNVCFCFYHFAYSQLLAAIRLFVLCFVDNCCETLL